MIDVACFAATVGGVADVIAQLLHKQGHPLAIGRRCGLAQVPDGR
jgi:hypothetical protein